MTDSRRISSHFSTLKTTRGRPKTSTQIEQKLFDLWVMNSVISVDRRDGRDVVTISLDAFTKRYNEITSPHLIFGDKNK